MDEFLKQKKSHRQQVFRETGVRLGLPETIVEKDFWVCWLLGRIFRDEVLGKQLLFKSGTSLSKVYGLITPFSRLEVGNGYRPSPQGYEFSAGYN